MWGDDNTSRAMVHQLAQLLGIEVHQDPGAASIRRFG
jgi:hypothetical protein